MPVDAESYDEDPVREHGLQTPRDPLQYVAGFAYGLFSLSFALLHAPLLTPGVWTYIVTTLVTIWTLFSLCSYILAAVSPVHHEALEAPRINDIDLLRTSLGEGEVRCRPCGQIIAGKTTKHCHTCLKCVQGFDHHCRWLNHCVGERNYAYFAVFVANTAGALVIQGALGWWLSLESTYDFDTFRGRVHRAFESDARESAIAFSVFLWFIAILEFVVIVVIGQLYILHIELNIRGITTYEMIMYGRREQRERQAVREALGMPVLPSPRCHSLAVWQRKRELRRQAADAGLQNGVGQEGNDVDMARRPSVAVREAVEQTRNRYEQCDRSQESVAMHGDDVTEPSITHTPLGSGRSSLASSVISPPGHGGSAGFSSTRRRSSIAGGSLRSPIAAGSNTTPGQSPRATPAATTSALRLRLHSLGGINSTSPKHSSVGIIPGGIEGVSLGNALSSSRDSEGALGGSPRTVVEEMLARDATPMTTGDGSNGLVQDGPVRRMISGNLASSFRRSLGSAPPAGSFGSIAGCSGGAPPSAAQASMNGGGGTAAGSAAPDVVHGTPATGSPLYGYTSLPNARSFDGSPLSVSGRSPETAPSVDSAQLSAMGSP